MMKRLFGKLEKYGSFFALFRFPMATVFFRVVWSVRFGRYYSQEKIITRFFLGSQSNSKATR